MNFGNVRRHIRALRALAKIFDRRSVEPRHHLGLQFEPERADDAVAEGRGRRLRSAVLLLPSVTRSGTSNEK